MTKSLKKMDEPTVWKKVCICSKPFWSLSISKSKKSFCFWTKRIFWSRKSRVDELLSANIFRPSMVNLDGKIFSMRLLGNFHPLCFYSISDGRERTMITKVFWDTWGNCFRNKMINNTKSMSYTLALLTPKTFPESMPMYKVSSWKTSWAKSEPVRGSDHQLCDRKRRIRRIWNHFCLRIFLWFPLFLSKIRAAIFQPTWNKTNWLTFSYTIVHHQTLSLTILNYSTLWYTIVHYDILW